MAPGGRYYEGGWRLWVVSVTVVVEVAVVAVVVEVVVVVE